ncbi:glycoside hydrolase family 10 protein [Nonomuraea sp. NPDC050328]|uniref:glycoside hydrolase family 10 protein n=1 Tax=Nonomuraea sp. NPDC050328 TaxID=3364361 RepID=UPI00379C061D
MSAPSRRTVLRGLALAAAATAVPFSATQASAERAAWTPPLRQMRGMWIASVLNINWPSKPGLTVDEQKAEYLAWLDLAEQRKLNSIFLQIRPTADAFWPSPYEPWSQYITGTQGQDPGYDPLGFAVEETHKRGLSLHAWFNPYRVSMQADPNKLHPDHPGRKNPTWILPFGGKLYYNPGMPEVRKFCQDAMMHAIENYDLDGLHFDDYFYPTNSTAFNDAEAFAKYGAGFPDLAAWRRNNVDLMVQEMQQRVLASKPEIAWGISPSGIWRNKGTDPLGSDTNGGQSYDNLHADTRGWVKKGWLDYIAPQLYWYIGQPPADYAKLVPWWSDVADGTGTLLWIGQAAYKAGDPAQAPQWQDPKELSKHLTLNQSHPQITGDIWFSAGDVRADRLTSITTAVADHYQRPALSPVLPRLASGRRPHRAVVAQARTTSGGVEVKVVATGPQEPFQFAVFRFDSRPSAEQFENAANLVAVLPGDRHITWTDPEGKRGQYYYALAVDRANRVSRPSNGHRVIF